MFRTFQVARRCSMSHFIIKSIPKRPDVKIFTRNIYSGLIANHIEFNRYEPRALNHVERRLSSSNKRLQPFILPDIGEGIKEVVIKEWLVKVGDQVNEFDPLCEVESDKATATISSRYNGTISSIHYSVGDLASVGKPLVDIEVNSGPNTSEPERSNSVPKKEVSVDKFKDRNPSTNNNSSSIRTLPSVRRWASELGIDLSLVTATGRGGRILREDVENHLKGLAGEQTTQSISDLISSQISSSNSTTKLPFKTITKAMFKVMTEALKIPHFSYSDEIDLTKLVTQAKERKASGANDQVSNLAVIVKMVSLALLEYPQLNATIDEVGECLIQKNYHNIGIAMDTSNGLIVPNIKNVEQKTITEINSELDRLRQLAYDLKLGPAELTGGTLSLSNIGAIGGVFGVPVIMPPEIVIAALGRTRILPRFNFQGNIEARHIMQIVWSADHRVVDGATLCRFCNLLKEYLERPESTVIKLR